VERALFGSLTQAECAKHSACGSADAGELTIDATAVSRGLLFLTTAAAHARDQTHGAKPAAQTNTHSAPQTQAAARARRLGPLGVACSPGRGALRGARPPGRVALH
jgi:hypothetical protein